MPPVLPQKPRPPGAKKSAKNGAFCGSTPDSFGYVESSDGTKIFYAVEGQGYPLVFCYGLGCSSLHWTYQIEYFKKHYQTLWFDYRGHQNSEIPHQWETLTLAQNARDLGSILDELGLGKVILLGHSMGVNTALEFYQQQPHRISALILANGTAQRPLDTLFHHNSFQLGFTLLNQLQTFAPQVMRLLWKTQKQNPWLRTLVTLSGFNPHLTPQADIALYISQVAEMHPQVLLRLLNNYQNYNATPWLHTIHVPTLILAGDSDRIIPMEQQELMHQLIPQSELVVIRRGSHCSQMDLPELVNLEIEKFLSKIHYGPPSSLPKGSANQSTE